MTLSQKYTEICCIIIAISISFSECHAVGLCAILFMSSCDILAYGCSKFNNDVCFLQFFCYSFLCPIIFNQGTRWIVNGHVSRNVQLKINLFQFIFLHLSKVFYKEIVVSIIDPSQL